MKDLLIPISIFVIGLSYGFMLGYDSVVDNCIEYHVQLEGHPYTPQEMCNHILFNTSLPF